MYAGSWSQLGGSAIPSDLRARSIQPLSGLSIDCQMRTPATNGTTYGMKNRIRKMPAALRWRLLSRSATRNGQDDRDRQGERGELEGDPQRLPGLLVVEHLVVVVEPDEPERLGLLQVDVA